MIDLLQPRYLEVWGKFTPRGGLSIDPYFNYGKSGTKYEKMADYRLINYDLYPENIDNR
ncbi:7-cyano-7-deazaguanine reductase [Streptococcus infantarius subsp. infantarius]|nr:7-cyano-7-deazaguanine reductase [Streptococcus infantarius subsp. infantarius]MCO4672267.1 7-cyano-7-deazaguanine reductase [Streptococcus infantarius subsp. infantarius]MCO4674248.1 7-cyano-7-deazaguanine reductase [Streptococcus infantarius subsp. infantarius]